MPKMKMVKNDLKPIIQATLRYKEDRTPVILTGCTVKFHMKNGSKLLVDSAAVILVPSAGTVKYEWQSGDTNITGDCQAEFEVTFADGKTLTFPADGNFTISFRDEYA